MSDQNSPVHDRSAETTRWSRANFAEAIQGVQTPLGWTFWDHVMETSVRRAFGEIGALPAREVPPPPIPDDKISAVFFGLATGNVTTFHRIGEAMPGTSGDAVVEQMFGERRGPATVDPAPRSRLGYARVAGKMPVAATRSVRRIREARAELRTWWRAAVIDGPPTGIDDATTLLRASAERFIQIGTPHATLSMVGQAFAEQVEALAEQAWGSRERAADLMTGYGAMEETDIMADIWSVAHDQLSMSELLARHGFHGPDEGNLTSIVWRENPVPVQRLVDRYRSAAVAHPRAREATQLATRTAAEHRLLTDLPRSARPKARLVLRLARTLIPTRELGKAGFLHALDGARCAARVIGARLHEQGLLADPADVHFLTYQELTAGVTVGMHETVAERREDDRRFRGMTVPQSWTGNPVPEATGPTGDPADADATGADATDPGRLSGSAGTGGTGGADPAGGAAPVERLTGIGVVGAEVTGRARVALDPSEADLEPGDILVCRTTDPSWTPLFLVAEALVIDTGGAMSHGAIVARELGVPCVINTRTGTRDIPDGATITVNGRTGTVTISAGA